MSDYLSQVDESQRPAIPYGLIKIGFYNVQAPWAKCGYNGDFAYYLPVKNLVYVDKEPYLVEVFIKMKEEDRAKQKREYIKYKLDRGILS